MIDQLAWFKSSHSDNEGGDCVEVALSNARLTVHVRDSTNPTGPALTLSAPAWAAFISAGQPGA
ncbi:DUF397 domain-containing protein [Streptomyces scabiei]|uniref:DUF397 domain-containing protein n=1 Tax=Streptomyces scabiei TaxID=1930 RepID=UPI00298F9315|nr:DUF397 domain-containing protein [Streptomyces scabiei]MDW8810546.1 DUF397 domain-containing protein [Streptomyces scabiei]